MRALADTFTLRLVAVLLLGAAALAGCAGRGAGTPLHADAGAARAAAPPAVLDASGEAARAAPEAAEAADGDYDPWEPFNERMFAFNYGLDRRVVKPVASGWRRAVPEPLRKGLQNAVHNLGMPRRLVNNLLQGKVDGAVREVTAFVLNSTVGIAGLADVAGVEGVTPPDQEDTGQTLAVYGVRPGPYLVLPFFPPSTVRDTIGSAVDSFLDPLSLVLPLAGGIAKRVGTAVNDRSINLELFEEVEESVLDLYSGTRNLYLQRRERAIRE